MRGSSVCLWGPQVARRFGGANFTSFPLSCPTACLVPINRGARKPGAQFCPFSAKVGIQEPPGARRHPNGREATADTAARKCAVHEHLEPDYRLKAGLGPAQ